MQKVDQPDVGFVNLVAASSGFFFDAERPARQYLRDQTCVRLMSAGSEQRRDMQNCFKRQAVTPLLRQRRCQGWERVTYHNAEDGFCVLRVKARGQRDRVVVVGHPAVINAGQFITATGWWINDRGHGL